MRFLLVAGHQMSLEDELKLLIDSTALSDDLVWEGRAGRPTTLDGALKDVEALAALAKGLRFAVLRLAREVDQLREER
jgi:hypothetical protein